MKTNFFNRIIFLCSTSFLMLFSSFVTLAGSEKCLPKNYKFDKTYSKITHPLLPHDIWRSDNEKEVFFGCVKAEEKFVKEIVGEEASIPFHVNMTSQFSPLGTGTIMLGNMRNLRVFPLEIEVEPGEEYIALIHYIEGMSYASLIPYYSSDAIIWDRNYNNEIIFAGAWDFHVQANGTVYYPRFWDTIRFKVKKTYSNGKPVKKAIVRFMLSLAYMEEDKSSFFSLMKASEAYAKTFKETPRKDATKIINGAFY